MEVCAGMFHSKEVKQQLQQAETLGRQVETYEAMLQTAASDVTEAQMDVDQLQMSAAKMDRSLTKVVGYAKDTRDDQQVMEDGIQECVEVLRQDSLQVGQILEKSAKHTDFLHQQETALTDLMEQSKHYTGLAKSVSEGSNKETSEIKRLMEQMSGLEKFTGTISALALQAAIDAGRLGDEGADFIRSAEQIRSLAEVFGGQLSDTLEQAENLQKEITEMSGQIHQFISLLKDNNRALSKMATDVSRYNAGQTDTESPEASMAGLIETLQDYQGRVTDDISRQECILEEMEKIGTCYMEQEESTTHLEQTVAHMKQTFADAGGSEAQK